MWRKNDAIGYQGEQQNKVDPKGTTSLDQQPETRIMRKKAPNVSTQQEEWTVVTIKSTSKAKSLTTEEQNVGTYNGFNPLLGSNGQCVYKIQQRGDARGQCNFRSAVEDTNFYHNQ